MGLHDRDYTRDQPYDDYGYRQKKRTDGMSVTVRIIIVCFALWLANGIFYPENNLLMRAMAVRASTLFKPELWWQFVTAGFAHAPNSFWHIGCNMLALLIFGYGMALGIGGPRGFQFMRAQNVEDRLGRTEFFVFYLVTVIFGNIVYCVVNMATPNVGALGASGGVSGVVILYALLYPHQRMLLMGFIPMPMWLLGIGMVFMDAFGASGQVNTGIAHSVHLAGAGFALFYFLVFLRSGVTFTGPFIRFGKWLATPRRPKLKIHESGEEPEMPRKSAKDEQFDKRLDEVLKRYGEVGEAGLTHEERKFLREASKKYKNKQR